MDLDNKKIGIVVQKCQSVFVNGCFQQAYFTYKAIKNSGYDVIFLTGDDNYTKFEYPEVEIRKIAMDSNYDDICMIIYVSAFVTDKGFMKMIHDKGIKIVNQIGGNYFILTQESLMFDVHNREFFIANQYLDEIWLLPMYQFMKEYLEVMSDKPVKIVPYVWDSEIIDVYCEKNKIQPFYKKKSNLDGKIEKIIPFIMEPNMSIHKTCLAPLVIIEGMYKKNPDSILTSICFNPPDTKLFKKFIKDIQIGSKLQVYPRIPLPEFLKQISDWNGCPVLVAHQILNDLNFLLMELMYLGYPVVHNCHPYRDIGYYYSEHNVKEGINCIKQLMESHDLNLNKYMENSKRSLWRFNPNNPDNCKIYNSLISSLLSL